MPQQGDWISARDRLNSKPMGATSIKPTPPKSIPDRILQFLTGIPNPATATTDDIENGVGPADLSMAALPIFGRFGSQVVSPLHGVDDLERMAGRSVGDVNVYHGTTGSRAGQILKEGFKPLESGEAAAKQVADLYEIPWVEWQNRIEPINIGSGYGKAPARVSAGTYPIAARWASHFPQGELLTDLNHKARMYLGWKESGSQLPYDEWYENAWNMAKTLRGKQTSGLYERAPDLLGFPDRMPSPEGGAILGLTVDSRSIPPYTRDIVEHMLGRIRNGRESVDDMLRSWNYNYHDIKIHPSNVKDVSLASPRNTALARSLKK